VTGVKIIMIFLLEVRKMLPSVFDFGQHSTNLWPKNFNDNR